MARRTFGQGVLGLLGGVAFAALSGCRLFGGNSYRFRMMVQVETPGGVRTGSSVYEVGAGNKVAITREMATRDWSVKGEAVAVDLPGGRTLFAVRSTGAHFGDLMGLSMNTLHPNFRGTGYDVVEVAKELAQGEYPGPSEVAREDYPLLVTFGDIADPASIVRVEPDALATHFGEGVTLRCITVELTDDPVTTGIEKRLGWLPSHVGTLVRRPTDLPIGEMPIEQRLIRTDFRYGDAL
ncbi:MAG: hypothetical protein ACN4E6_15900 [Qipengyuania pacifica]